MLLQSVSLENDHICIRQYGDEIAELMKQINASYAELDRLLLEKETLEQEWRT